MYQASTGDAPMDYVSRTFTISAGDVVGNYSRDPETGTLIRDHVEQMTVWVDNVAPVVTQSEARTGIKLGETETVLSGTVSDGGPTTDVFVHVQTPTGEMYKRQAARDSGRWWFDLEPLIEGEYTLWVHASDLAGNVTSVGPFHVSTLKRLYLPLVGKGYVNAPDLVVERIVATATDVEMVIVNRGNNPAIEDFWVDAYVDPQTVPTAVNQTWEMVGSQGLVWGVTADLAPGETLTLTVGGDHYIADYSQVTWPLAADTPVYAQVDSANAETSYGAVLEAHEITSAAYNNIAGPALPTAGGETRTPGIEPSNQPFQRADLPRRPKK
jgi:hypothetical protein